MSNLGGRMKSKLYLLLALLVAFAGGLLWPRPAQVNYVIQGYVDTATLAEHGYLGRSSTENVTIYYNLSVGWLVKWDAGSSYNGTKEYYIQRLEGWAKERDLPVIIILPKVEYVNREVIKEVEKIVYQDKPVIPRWFTSEAELKAWLSAHRVGNEIPIPLIVTPNGVTRFNDNSVDCDDFAE